MTPTEMLDRIRRFCDDLAGPIQVLEQLHAVLDGTNDENCDATLPPRVPIRLMTDEEPVDEPADEDVSSSTFAARHRAQQERDEKASRAAQSRSTVRDDRWDYAEVARVAVSAQERGESMTAAVARLRQRCTPGAAQMAISNARKHGFDIPSAPRGRTKVAPVEPAEPARPTVSDIAALEADLFDDEVDP